VEFSVLCTTGLKQSQATLVNISFTGALFESSVIVPPPGAIVKVELIDRQDEKPTSVIGRVVRYTPRGFAIEFISISARLQQLIEELE